MYLLMGSKAPASFQELGALCAIVALGVGGYCSEKLGKARVWMTNLSQNWGGHACAEAYARNRPQIAGAVST